MRKVLFPLAFVAVLNYNCKKSNNNENDEYDYPTGALTSNFSDIPGIRKIEDIDTSSLPVFQRPGGVTPYGYIIDLMPSPEFLQEPKKQIGGSCVAWAFCNVLDYEYKIIERNDIYGAADKIFSPYFLFNQRTQNTNADKGLAPKDAIQILRTQGSCKWVDMPNPGTTPYNMQPSVSARTNAGFYKISDVGKMWRLTSLSELPHIKSLIRRNYPLVFAAKIDYGFMKPGSKGYRQASDGRYVWKSYCNDCTPIPRSPNADMNHAMVLCGYDNDINAFKVLNSWGPSWGNNGYIWIDYDFFLTAVLRANDDSPEIYWIEAKRVGGTATTIPVNSILPTSAISGGTIAIGPGITVSERGVCYSTDINPTTGSTLISNNSVASGSGNGTFSVTISGLIPNKLYWIRAYAKTSAGILYGNELSFTTPVSSGGGNTVTDIDGNVYHTVQIGTQMWMVENLKTSKYRDGTSIPNVTDATQWNGLITGAWCNYNNDPALGNTYGKLYNWFAVNNPKGLAPTGWHVPTREEWTTLYGYVGSSSLAYMDPRWVANATNSSGFSALPGGWRGFAELGTSAYWWTSTYGAIGGNGRPYWRVYLSPSSVGLVITSFTGGIETNGYSIRCIKD